MAASVYLCLIVLFQFCHGLPARYNVESPIGAQPMVQDMMQSGPLPYALEVVQRRRNEWRKHQQTVHPEEPPKRRRKAVDAESETPMPLADPIAAEREETRNPAPVLPTPEQHDGSKTTIDSSHESSSSELDYKPIIKKRTRLYKLPYINPRNGHRRDSVSVEEMTFVDPRFSSSESAYYTSTSYSDYEAYEEPSSESAPLELNALHDAPFGGNPLDEVRMNYQNTDRYIPSRKTPTKHAKKHQKDNSQPKTSPPPLDPLGMQDYIEHMTAEKKIKKNKHSVSMNGPNPDYAAKVIERQYDAVISSKTAAQGYPSSNAHGYPVEHNMIPQQQMNMQQYLNMQQNMDRQLNMNMQQNVPRTMDRDQMQQLINAQYHAMVQRQ